MNLIRIAKVAWFGLRLAQKLDTIASSHSHSPDSTAVTKAMLKFSDRALSLYNIQGDAVKREAAGAIADVLMQKLMKPEDDL